MDVRIVHCIGGAAEGEGLAVVIDVFRAASTACVAAANGAERIVPVAEIEAAFALKRAHPEWVLMGERDYRKVSGFDFGNSPAEIEQVDFTGRTVIQATSAGTRGLVEAAGRAEEVLFGCFANAAATVAYVRSRSPAVVTLAALGTGGDSRAPEDDMCAIYLKNELDGFPNSFAAIKRYLATVESARKFFDPAQDFAPERDFELCLDLDRFDFALRCGSWEGQGPCLYPIRP